MREGPVGVARLWPGDGEQKMRIDHDGKLRSKNRAAGRAEEGRGRTGLGGQVWEDRFVRTGL